MTVNSGKTADSVQMPFRMVSGVGPRNCVLDGVHIGATWQIWLDVCAIITGSATRGDDVDLSQITFGFFVTI